MSGWIDGVVQGEQRLKLLCMRQATVGLAWSCKAEHKQKWLLGRRMRLER